MHRKYEVTRIYVRGATYFCLRTREVNFTGSNEIINNNFFKEGYTPPSLPES